jgi:lysophospholipase L1-like esterase
MIRTFAGAILAVGAVLALAAPAPAQSFFFKDGDTVVVIGDSITEQHLYSNYLEMWTVSRFPKWKLTFRNVGIGGDRSTGGNGRFKRDVLPFHPTAMTVDFGMNDGNYRAFDEGAYKTYFNGLQGMADQAKAARIRVAWITPQPIENHNDVKFEAVYNDTLEKFGNGVKEIAAKNDGLFVDQFHTFQDAMKKARAAQSEGRVHIGGGDAVHPGPAGQALMAYGILKGLGFPELVSSAEVDAATGQGTGKNCTISDGKAADGGVRFKRLDDALPFFPDEAKGIEKVVPIRSSLNQYLLTVKGLKPGKYEIRLGGKKVAEHSADDLAKGVNLAEGALQAGPVADQVKAVWQAVQAKNKYYHDRIFRGVVLSSAQIPDWLDIKITPQEIEAKKKAAIEKRLEKLPELDEAIRKALEMKPHEVEIVPVK